MALDPTKNYQQLLGQIAKAYDRGRSQAVQAVNIQLLETYWQIGHYIVEFEQGGAATARYGQSLIKKLSQDLKTQLGKGFSISNLKRFRQFYLLYPNGATVSHHLSWSHFIELLKIG